jgi:DNA-binding CsgD family transcriptional regulator
VTACLSGASIPGLRPQGAAARLAVGGGRERQGDGRRPEAPAAVRQEAGPPGELTSSERQGLRDVEPPVTSPASAPAAALVGRAAQCATVDRIVAEIRGGASRSLQLRGDPGIGKSVLLDYAAAAAAGFLVIRVTGIESEMEFAFAALQQACAPLLKHLDRIPAPQADALRVAFGLSHGDPPDRFLVGLGVLGLAAEEAAAQPLLFIVDDAQWIDQTSLQALAVMTRRLYGESVGVIFAGRSEAVRVELAGLPGLTVPGLAEPDARALLAGLVPGRLDDRVRDRIIAEAAGNPLALVEFSREVTEAGELAGGFGVSPWIARPLADRVAERYLARTVGLPAATRRLLLVAAAEPLGDPVLLRLACDALGLSTADLAPAEAAGLVRLGGHVAFRHPLVRSAIYRSAPTADRQAAHAALAAVTDPLRHPDHQAWHRAQATFGPDEAVAADLERSAHRALSRGGPAAAAAFLAHAAALSPDAAERARRNLAAAQPKFEAGANREAAELLAAARAGPLDELQRARADQLGARIATSSGAGGDPPRLLLEAAVRLAKADGELARRAYLDAFMSALLTGGRGGTGWQDVGRAAVAAPPSAGRRQADDLLLEGLTAQATDGYQAGLPALREALRSLAEGAADRHPDGTAAGQQGVPSVGRVSILWLACRVAMNLWDDESLVVLAGRMVDAARGTGTLHELPAAFGMAATGTMLTGDLAAATAWIEQLEAVHAVIGAVRAVHGRLALTAWQGLAGKHAAEAAADQADGNRAAALGISAYTTALLNNGLGRYAEAAAAASTVFALTGQLGYTLWALPELAEAAARSGNAALAGQAVALLERTTRPSGTEWALGIEARSRALISEGERAGELYAEAVARLGKTRVVPHLARAHLLYGEWLRREKRKTDARAQLRTAREMFAAMGAAGFTARAERELAATGERVPRRDLRQVAALTAQEAQVARLVAVGHSNPEIAAELFISPRTVEYHLHKIFGKLDITGRGQLARALSAR